VAASGLSTRVLHLLLDQNASGENGYSVCGVMFSGSLARKAVAFDSFSQGQHHKYPNNDIAVYRFLGIISTSFHHISIASTVSGMSTIVSIF